MIPAASGLAAINKKQILWFSSGVPILWRTQRNGPDFHITIKIHSQDGTVPRNEHVHSFTLILSLRGKRFHQYGIDKLTELFSAIRS